MKVNLSLCLAAVLLIGATELWSSKTVLSIVGASHLIRHGTEAKEIRVHLFHDHKVYVEEITQGPSSAPACKLFVTVMPDPQFQQIMKVEESPELKDNRNLQNGSGMHSRDEDVWHIVFRNGRTRFFTFSSPQSQPPANFITWFEEARSLKPLDNVQVSTPGRCELFSQEMANAWQR